MGDKVWDFVSAGLQDKSFDVVALAETHVSRSALLPWQKKARRDKIRMYANPARKTGRAVTMAGQDRDTEGGEWILMPGHRQAHSLSHQLDRVQEFQFDGQLTVDVGMASSNIQRFAKLGAFLAALKLPWVLLGDFNMSASALGKAGFFARVGGQP
eukprot:893513-Pyramimonas_sp.AAC.1